MDYRYIDESGRMAGPVPEGAIRALYKAGVIKITTPIAEAQSEDWEPYSFVFGASNGPLPPPYAAPEPPPTFTKRSAPKPEHRDYAQQSRAGFWWWVLAGIAVVAVAAVGVTAKRPSLLLPSATALKGNDAPPAVVSVPAPVEKPAAPGLIATAIAAVSKTVSLTPAEKPAAAPEKIDSLAEWYDFGFHQGREARVVFGTLERKLEPDKAQLVRLLENMEFDALKVSQENLQACFEGYKDGCLDTKPVRLVSVTQRKSSLPEKLRGYQKFPDDKKAEASTNNEALEHALACTVMIISLNARDGSQGSGFFIGPGVILTNKHVVDGYDHFLIRMPDKSVLEGSLVAFMPAADIALISVQISNNPIMKLAASKSVRVGDHVVAVGFPESDTIAKFSGNKRSIEEVMMGLEASSSFGQISAINRQFDNQDCFQVDVTINHGNSGGPMIDSEGRVIGVNTFGLAATGLDRINFALKLTPVIAFIRANCSFNVELED